MIDWSSVGEVLDVLARLFATLTVIGTVGLFAHLLSRGDDC